MGCGSSSAQVFPTRVRPGVGSTSVEFRPLPEKEEEGNERAHSYDAKSPPYNATNSRYGDSGESSQVTALNDVQQKQTSRFGSTSFRNWQHDVEDAKAPVVDRRHLLKQAFAAIDSSGTGSMELSDFFNAAQDAGDRDTLPTVYVFMECDTAIGAAGKMRTRDWVKGMTTCAFEISDAEFAAEIKSMLKGLGVEYKPHAASAG